MEQIVDFIQNKIFTWNKRAIIFMLLNSFTPTLINDFVRLGI